ncbi:hypothetical protein Tco_0334296, partial [Tanacetum coccineum]
MMSLLTPVVTSRYPTTNNQLRNSSNPRQQATINNGRVTLQPIQGRQTSLAADTTRKYTPGASGSNSGKQRTVRMAICLNTALNLRGNGMILGLRIKCYWYKLKQVVEFYMRRNLHFLQIQEFQKDKLHRLSLLTML